MMQFVREIDQAMLVQKELNNLEQWGFTLVWTEDSVVIYAQVADTRIQCNDERKAA